MTQPKARSLRPLFAFVACALLASCSPAPPAIVPPKPGPTLAPTAEQGEQTLIVSVAASTNEAVTELCEQFLSETGVEAKVNAGPSNGLATQILAGAPAGLFLSASAEWADKIDQAGQAASRVDLFTNRLVVIVPKGNPAGVHKPEDLASAAVKKLALAGENVPAGKYAGQALAKLGLDGKLNDAGTIVRGQDVRAALGFVERGEAEAGIVYATDVGAAPGVEVACELDPTLYDKIVYVLVLLKHEPESPAAKELYEFLQGAGAQAVYAKLGFISLIQK
jgi:molybdate transport system substrate-binding protein